MLTLKLFLCNAFLNKHLKYIFLLQSFNVCYLLILLIKYELLDPLSYLELNLQLAENAFATIFP